MKKIYSTGPFGELYKIVLIDAFLERCEAIQSLMKTSFSLQDGESIEAYKAISGEFHRSTHARITPEQITIGVFWEEGWERISDYERSIDDLPDVWFSDHLLWKFTTYAHRFSSDTISEADVDEEDRDLFQMEVKRYQKLLDDEETKRKK